MDEQFEQGVMKKLAQEHPGVSFDIAVSERTFYPLDEETQVLGRGVRVYFAECKNVETNQTVFIYAEQEQ